jgi:hypothetical protein
MNTVFLVTYFWDNLEDYGLNMGGNDTLGVFDSYDSAYEAVQKIKAQHEEFCKETMELAKNTDDEWHEPHRFEDYKETKGINGETAFVWKTVTNDDGCSCGHCFEIKEVTINDYSIETFALTH